MDIPAGLTAVDFALSKMGVLRKLSADWKNAEHRAALLEAFEALLATKEENLRLREKLSEREDWNAQSQRYDLVTTTGGAHVYRYSPALRDAEIHEARMLHLDELENAPPVTPDHYACPVCYGKKYISILQTRRNVTGEYFCPVCRTSFPVEKDEGVGPATVV